MGADGEVERAVRERQMWQRVPAEQSSTRRGSRSGSSAKNATYSANDREVTSTYGKEPT